MQRKIDLLKETLQHKEEEDINQDIIEFVKLTIKILRNKLKRTETKKEIIDLIYKVRYYKSIPINRNDNISSIKEISKELKKLEMEIITVACNLKALNIITPNIKENYKIIMSILDIGIIDLETIHIEAKQENKVLAISIYEDKTFEKTIKFNTIPELNIKLNKKIKLFL